MPPSALLAMVGPRVANHVLHTLHDAFPDRFPLSPTLENFAERRDGHRRSRGDDRQSVDEIHDAILEALADECAARARRGGRRVGRRDRRLPDPRRRVPVLPRRPDDVSRPGGRLRARLGPAARTSPIRDATSHRPTRSGTVRHTAPLDAPETRECADPQGKQHHSRVLRICTRPTSTRHIRRRSRQRAWKPAALRAQAWYGEPFLHPGEDPAVALAPGTARRGRSTTRSPRWTPGNRAPVQPLARALRPDARPRARARVADAGDRGGHRAAAPPGRRARRDADRADRREPARRRGERQRERQRRSAGEPTRAGRARRGGRRLRRRSRRRRRRSRSRRSPATTRAPSRRYRFRHPTASGKTIAAAGFVEAARHLGVLILTHRRLLVSQFQRDLTTEGYAERFTDAIDTGKEPLRDDPITIQTYAWFARHAGEISRTAYQLVICDEAHTALGEKTSAAIRVVQRAGLHRHDRDRAADREAGLRRLPGLGRRPAARRRRAARADRPAALPRVPPAAAINSVPIVGGDFEERALAAALDHSALNQAAASLYRERFGTTPGIVYAAGVEHAYNLAQEFRAAGHQGRGGLGQDAAREARRDARRLRAR